MAKRNMASAAVAEVESTTAVDIPSAARVPKIRLITRTEIHPDPDQPRQAADSELRDSIARNGLLQPLTVRPHPTLSSEWMIVDGERRWRSSEGVLNDLPCIVRQDMDALARRLATQLEANTGKSLTPLEEARAFAQIMAYEQISTSELAAFLGRAPSTVAERVALLDLGPWLPLIEAGDVIMSHAVKVLLPLRAVPDSFHEHAIELLRKDYRYQNKGRGEGISLGDFARLVGQIYKGAMYPLTKTKSTWHKQPEFSTTKHDAECGCGGVRFDLDGADVARLCCANPEWWKPKRAAAVKAAKEKEKLDAELGRATPANDEKRVYLPAGARVEKLASWLEPRGAVLLTSTAGTWEIGRSHGERPDFNPAEVAGNCASTHLVELRSGPHDFPRVAIADGSPALANARAAWATRWSERREEIAEGLGQLLQPQLVFHRVTGAGARQLLIALAQCDTDVPTQMVDVAEVLGISLPDMGSFGRSANDESWLPELSEDEIEMLATGLAAFRAQELRGVSEQVDEQQREALEAIAKKKVPWLKAPKASKKGRKAAATPLAIEGKKISEETIPLPLDEDDDDEEVAWTGQGDDSDDDLWDAAPGEEEEEEIPVIARER